MSTSFENPDPDELMDDLHRVGPDKPLGYLPLVTISEICLQDVSVVKQDCEDRGLVALLLNQDESRVHSGALYVYDEPALQGLLDTNQPTLRNNGWPVEARGFVGRVVAETTTEPELYKLIARSFADKRSDDEIQQHFNRAYGSVAHL